MMYDYVSQIESEGMVLKYGCIYGNEKIVYIKAGLGGDYLGDENKYLRIAKRLHQKYGCSIISASNPHIENMHVDIDYDMKIIRSFLQKHKLNNPQLYFFGNSNGCIKGIELAAKGIPFQRMILINMPLMINFHKTKKWISKIYETDIIAVYGKRDPSYSYVPFIDGITDNFKTVIIPDADHNFVGKMDDFIALADKLMD